MSQTDRNAGRIPENRRSLLEDDLAMVRETLEGFGSYRFSDELIRNMTERNLSASELARRCRVSHAAVGKWRSGSAKPVGKERVKEAGLALSLDEDGLNKVLLSLGYAGLYEKNPLDNACIFTIRKQPDDPVGFYRNILEEFRLKSAAPSPRRKYMSTSKVRKSFAHVYTEASFRGWLTRYADSFSAFAKTALPNKELILYALLFLGGSSINEMYETGELPVSIRNLLYPLIAGSEIGQKGLREKLIVFGLLRNMPEEEIDRLLLLAKLRLFSQAETRPETAALAAVRCAHSRYAAYEYECLAGVCAVIGALLENEAEKQPPQNPTNSGMRRHSFYSGLQAELLPRLELAGQLAENYERPGHRGVEEKLFEELYTEAGAKCLAHYVKDILTLLIAEGDIDVKEAEDWLDLLQL